MAINPELLDAGSRQPLPHMQGAAFDARACATVTEAFEAAGILDTTFSLDTLTYGPDHLPVQSDRLLVQHSRMGHRPLGVVGARYQMIDNRALAMTLDALTPTCRPDAVGTLHGDRTTFITLQAGAFDVHGDPHAGYLVCSETRGGDQAMRLFLMTNRLACSNMLPGGWAAANERVTLNHRGDMDRRLDNTVELFTGLRRAQREQQEFLDALVGHRLTVTAQDDVLDQVYPLPTTPARLRFLSGHGGPLSPAVATEVGQLSHTFELAVEHQRQVRLAAQVYLTRFRDEFPQFAATAYAPLCAVTETESTRATRTASALLERTFFGEGRAITQRAFSVLRAATALN